MIPPPRPWAHALAANERSTMTDPSDSLIRGINFEADGSVIIEYCHQSDLKSNGVVLNHLLAIPVGDQYDDEIFAVHQAIQALLADVIEDLPFMAPAPIDEGGDDDDNDDDDDDDAPTPA